MERFFLILLVIGDLIGLILSLLFLLLAFCGWREYT